MKINENMATCVAEAIQEQIVARIGEGYRVEVKRVNKNGNVLHGVMMVPVDGPKPIASPVLYLEEMAGSDQFTDIVLAIQAIADELIKINIFPDEDIMIRIFLWSIWTYFSKTEPQFQQMLYTNHLLVTYALF